PPEAWFRRLRPVGRTVLAKSLLGWAGAVLNHAIPSSGGPGPQIGARLIVSSSRERNDRSKPSNKGFSKGGPGAAKVSGKGGGKGGPPGRPPQREASR